MTSVAEASNVVRTLGKSISFAPTKPLFAQRAAVSLAEVESTNSAALEEVEGRKYYAKR